jgi:Ca2+-binding RTX toxin-like protein
MGGADTMNGGRGNDDYAVNHAGDEINEASTGGIDLAVSSIDYTLPAFVEDIALLEEGGAIDGAGNGLRNFMAGNGFGNLLEGLGGDDTITGLAGRDELRGGDGADQLWGESGRDTLDGGSGRDQLQGGAGDDSLDGGGGADRLFGGDGDDVLVWDGADLRVFGGAGQGDVLRLLSGDLDLRTVADGTITGIERIDMTGGTNTLTLRRAELLDISSTTDVLRVLGEAGDTVDIASAFTRRGDLNGYTRYDVARGVLWIDSDITVV